MEENNPVCPSSSESTRSGFAHQEDFPPDDTNRPDCLAVMYHYVRDHDAARAYDFPCINPIDFGRQVDRLCEQREPIDWPTLYAWRQGRKSIPRRCFLLTFDDGLADHAQVVLPILERRGIHGVFFVPGAMLATQRMLAAHAVHLLLATLGEKALEREVEKELSIQSPDTDWAASIREPNAAALYHYESPQRARLKYGLTVALPIALRNRIVDTLFERRIGSSRRWARTWYLGWDDLTNMQSAGHTIGGHGFRHEPYQRLTPRETATDIERVAEILRDGLGPGIRPFSYPYGSFMDETCTACRAAGFAHAFTTERRSIATDCEVMRLPRIDTIYVTDVLNEEPLCAIPQAAKRSS